MEDQGKRLLIAISIIFAIMVGWTFLFPPEPPPEEQRKEIPSQPMPSAPAPAAGPGAARPAAGTGTSTTPRGPEQEVVFAFPDFRATFSTYGGALKSWQLLGRQFFA